MGDRAAQSGGQTNPRSLEKYATESTQQIVKAHQVFRGRESGKLFLDIFFLFRASVRVIMERIFGIMFVLTAAMQKASALQCWKCSSDIDPMCNDRFNQSDILSRRGGGFYSPLTQRQPYDQQGYNQNYNPNYNNQNYNQNFNNNYNPAAQTNSWPVLDNCDDNEARLRRMRNVCMKKVIRGPGYSSIIRRCAIIPPEQTVGTCNEPVSRGLSLEFCEYCDYDGCNSATGLKTNYVLLGSILAVFGFVLSN